MLTPFIDFSGEQFSFLSSQKGSQYWGPLGLFGVFWWVSFLSILGFFSLWTDPVILPLALTWSNHNPVSLLSPKPLPSRHWQILLRKTLLITPFKFTGELTKSNESWGWHFKYGNSRHSNKFSVTNIIFGPPYFCRAV